MVVLIVLLWGILAGAAYSWQKDTPLCYIKNNTIRRLLVVVILPWALVLLLGLCAVLMFDDAVRELREQLDFPISFRELWNGKK